MRVFINHSIPPLQILHLRRLQMLQFTQEAKNTKESTLKFLQKHSKAISYLEKGMKGVEVSKLCGISLNTITKIKKKLQSELV